MLATNTCRDTEVEFLHHRAEPLHGTKIVANDLPC